MTANELIQYIIDNDKIEYILSELGCHHIKPYTKEFRAGLPNHSSKTAISVKKETLKVKVFQSDSNIIRGNIFTLVMTIRDINFPQANKYLHELMGLEYNFDFKKHKEKKKEEANDPLAIFKKVKRRSCCVNLEDVNLFDNSILKEYIPLPHIDWIREGIMPWTCDKFKIGYSAERKRIIIPERFWSGTENDYIGIMGRTTIKEYELLDIPKYLAIKNYYKTLNLYGLQENYQTIQEAGYVNVAESQKSVLKRHSRNDGTHVAVGCHDISDEQARILIGLNVDIVIQMDKGIDQNHVRSLCNKFYGIRNVSYVWDKYDLLNDKESPADKPNAIYNYLFKYRIKYDKSERRKYLQWLEKQKKS